MAAGVVVRRVLLPGDQLLWVEELPVGAEAHLVHHRRLQVDEDGARDVVAVAHLIEEGTARVDGLLLLGHVAAEEVGERRGKLESGRLF